VDAPARIAPECPSLLLSDGTQLRLRPLQASDRDGVAALFARLSPTSRFRRFLSPKPGLSSRELTHLTDIDHRRHEAIAAVDDGDESILGVARYVTYSDCSEVADVAVEVADERHRMGIGTAVTRCVIQRARENGIRRLTATTLWENRSARALLRRVGFRPVLSTGVEIEWELKLTSELRLAILARS
jgi:RimJ/RimL family protein N-acetyltransferase